VPTATLSAARAVPIALHAAAAASAIGIANRNRGSISLLPCLVWRYLSNLRKQGKAQRGFIRFVGRVRRDSAVTRQSHTAGRMADYADANPPYATPNNFCALRWQIFSLSVWEISSDAITFMVSRM